MAAGVLRGVSRAQWLAIAGIVVGYVVTRWLFIDRFPYFLDEGTYAVFANRAANDTGDLFYSYTIGREPLMFWLGIPWIKLGINPLISVRLVSAVAGLLTLVFVGLLARRYAGAAAGLTAAALCVVIPFFVVHDGIGIIEPMVTLVMAAALYLQVEFARRPDLRVAALLGLVLAAGMWTKENTTPALALLPLSLLVLDWSPDGRAERLKRWLVGVAIAVAMVVAAKLLLRVSDMYDLYEASRDDPLLYTVRPIGDVLSDPFGVLGQTWDAYHPAFTGYITIPLLAVALAGAVLGLRSQPRLTALLLDARVLDHPDTAEYPGTDDLQYVTGTGAGSVWPAVADTIREHARGPRVPILTTRSYSQVLEMLLGPDNPRYVFVPGKSPLALKAQFSLDDNEIPFYDPEAAEVVREGDFVEIGRYQRPRDGAVLVLSERR
jgi:Dolichyl-phosphate-mannose-protein mannosyltransferase